MKSIFIVFALPRRYSPVVRCVTWRPLSSKFACVKSMPVQSPVNAPPSTHDAEAVKQMLRSRARGRPARGTSVIDPFRACVGTPLFRRCNEQDETFDSHPGGVRDRSAG